jgi:hypothetical protein
MMWLFRQVGDLIEIVFHRQRWMARPLRPARHGPLTAKDLIYRR